MFIPKKLVDTLHIHTIQLENFNLKQVQLVKHYWKHKFNLSLLTELKSNNKELVRKFEGIGLSIFGLRALLMKKCQQNSKKYEPSFETCFLVSVQCKTIPCPERQSSKAVMTQRSQYIDVTDQKIVKSCSNYS